MNQIITLIDDILNRDINYNLEHSEYEVYYYFDGNIFDFDVITNHLNDGPKSFVMISNIIPLLLKLLVVIYLSEFKKNLIIIIFIYVIADIILQFLELYV